MGDVLMKVIEMIFLGLTIIIPSLFILLGILKAKKFKRNKKFRNTLIKLIFLSLIINGFIFGVVKMYNTKMSIIFENAPKIVDKTRSNKTSKGFTIETKDGVTYVDGYMIANKTYSLPSDYVPTGTHKAVEEDNCQECIIEEAYQAYTKMKSDAASQGLSLWIASGYRSYSYQENLYNGYVKRSGKEAADTFSSRAGYSEHQTGYAFDLNSVTDDFATTKEGIWINENCYKYGFILRYPKGKENETGYKYESWHLRYVGIELASKLYNAGDWITMEDYFGITSEYAS